jgi:hypothetical protein
MPELSQEQFLERIAYVRFAFRARKAEVDSARLAEALVSTFQAGYSGNHQPFPPNSLTLHRGRIASSGEPLPRLGDHWYPPAQFASYNRANLPGESVFYCSFGNGTSLLELRPKMGNVISMMECRIAKDPFRLKWIAKQDHFGMLQGSDRQAEFERLCAEVYAQGSASAHQYMITGGYASLFCRLGFLDGIAYSSVATDCRGVNLALKGSVADQFVEPVSFRAFRVTELRSAFDFRVVCAASAGPPDVSGKISWMLVASCQGHSVNWSLYDREKPDSVPASCSGEA